jgi:hypothetical protein
MYIFHIPDSAAKVALQGIEVLLRWLQQAGGSCPTLHPSETFPEVRFFLMYGQTRERLNLSSCRQNGCGTSSAHRSGTRFGSP